MGIEFPIEVKSIRFSKEEVLQLNILFGGKCGDMVQVRPCDEQFEGKTFLGILLGDIALSQSVAWDKQKGELIVQRAMYNPAIFIPDRDAIVYGCGSWWGKIEDETQLRQITNEDIQNVWYVKALKQLTTQTKERVE